jgi:antitoxin ParD1/3/4
MTQNSMNIAVPESMKEFVLTQVAKGGYSTASEYVRQLIRDDQKRKAGDRLDALLLEGLKEGGSGPMTKQDWRDIREQVKSRLKRKRK